MKSQGWRSWLPLLLTTLLLSLGRSGQAAELSPPAEEFPRPLSTYASQPGESLWDMLQSRARAEPFNLLATGLFLLAITHTFVASRFTRVAHRFEVEHKRQLAARLNGR